MRLFIAQTAIVVLLAYGGMTSVRGQAMSSTSKVTLVDLSFITGSWRADWGGGVGEEHWSTPLGDSMVGTFRFVKDGKARFYELMFIEQTSEGPVLRLKHFNPGLIGWEEKTQVYSYPLVEYQKSFAVFERGDKKSRLTFRRTSAETLAVTLDQTTDDKRHSEEFKFTLMK